MTDTAAVPAIRQPAREIRVVDDAIPILDTARFEHMQRIAGAMAQGSLIPQTLRGEGTGDKFQPFEQAMVVANVFRVVNQAVRWNMDPFSVIDHASVVHGRLMWEGKLVHAVVEARLGIRLKHTFGRMVEVEQDSGTKVWKFDPTEEGAGVFLAVQVSGTFPDGETETIEGTVEQWKTTGNNSPWSPANFKRQLRYRGTREWARAHAPGVMLGVLTNDEVLEDVEVQERVTASRGRGERVSLRGKLPAAGAQPGFDPNHIASQTAMGGGAEDVIEAEVIEPTEPTPPENDPPEPRTESEQKDQLAAALASLTPAPKPEPEPVPAAEVQPDPITDPEEAIDSADDLIRQNAYDDGYAGEPIDAVLVMCEDEREQEIARASYEEGKAARIEREAAEHAASEEAPVTDLQAGADADQAAHEADVAADDLTRAATPAEIEQAKAAEAPAPEPQADAPEIADVAGPAPAGEKYLLGTEEPASDGKLNLYQDGEVFSRIDAAKAAGKYSRYDGHPQPADPMLASQSGGTGIVPPAEPEPAAEPAPEAPAEDAPLDPASEPQAVTGTTIRPNGLYLDLAAKESWLQIKPLLTELYGSADFKALSAADQAATRANLFGAVLEMKERTRDPVDWATDAAAFGLWIDWMAGSSDSASDKLEAISGTFQTLQGGKMWKERLTDGQRTALEARVAGVLAKIRMA